MRIGDIIVNSAGLRRQVIAFNRAIKMGRCADETGRSYDVADDDAEWTTLWNPPEEWPFLTVPIGRGSIQGVRQGLENLTRFMQWVTPDIDSRGGPLYVHPDLALRYGDALIITYRPGSPGVRVAIPRSFGTMAERAQRAEEVPRAPLTAFDHILEDDDDDP